MVNPSIEGIKTRKTLNVDKSIKKTCPLRLSDQGTKNQSRKEAYLSRKTVGTEPGKDLLSGTENSLGGLGEVESKVAAQHLSSANDDIYSLPTMRSKVQPKKKSLLLHFPGDLRTLATDKNWYERFKKNTSDSNSMFQFEN